MSAAGSNSDPVALDPGEMEQAIDQATAAVEIQSRALEELGDSQTSSNPMGLSHLLDVPVQIAVEVGRVRISLAELVRQGPGSVLELDRLAHEPADVLVNGKVVARGEVVTIGENYGVRITSVVRETGRG